MPTRKHMMLFRDCVPDLNRGVMDRLGKLHVLRIIKTSKCQSRHEALANRQQAEKTIQALPRLKQI
jgi:hypothetical protein